jgi:hypothetical protein
MRRGVLASAAFVVAIGLGSPPVASGAVTIGSDLDHPANDAPNCGMVNCTFAQKTLIAGNTAPGGLTSPISGVAVRFRVNYVGAAPSAPITFRVLRPAGAGKFTGAGTSAGLFPPNTIGGATYSVDARIPVRAGDSIGIDCCVGVQHMIAYRPPGIHVSEGSTYGWFPALADGSAPTPSNSDDPDYEILANADVEPDADADGFGDETQDACPTNAATQGACPATAPKKPKKCKRKKKRRAAEAAKKKRCKKHKKRR